MDLDKLGLLTLIVLGAIFLGWFIVGGDYNRRRAGKLAQWSYEGLKPYLGTAAIRWITTPSLSANLGQFRWRTGDRGFTPNGRRPLRISALL